MPDKPRFFYFWVKLTPEEKKRLSDDSGIAFSSLSSLAHGHRKAGHVTIAKLNRVDPRITAEMLRPDLYVDDPV